MVNWLVLLAAVREQSASTHATKWFEAMAVSEVMLVASRVEKFLKKSRYSRKTGLK